MMPPGVASWGRGAPPPPTPTAQQGYASARSGSAVIWGTVWVWYPLFQRAKLYFPSPRGHEECRPSPSGSGLVHAAAEMSRLEARRPGGGQGAHGSHSRPGFAFTAVML